MWTVMQKRQPPAKVSQPIARSDAEVMQAAARLRRDSAAMRRLLADPGEGCEEFKRTGAQRAARKEELATELERLVTA